MSEHGPTASDLHEQAQGVAPEHQDAELAASEPEPSGAGDAAAAEAPVSADDTSAPELPPGFTRDAGGNIRDHDNSIVVMFAVSGQFYAEDQEDAYKLLRAHFLDASRNPDAGTLGSVAVTKV
jgi:hypothetical protein